MRFIPTRVGNMSLRHTATGVQDRFIPTRVGNMTGTGAKQPLGIGSSPRVWGTFMVLRSLRSSSRFIPTRVGNIQCHRALATGGTVHPHACGEHTWE